MNANGGNFGSSDDAWLSEQLFAQLRDFSSEYKERLTSNEIMMNDIFQPYHNPDFSGDLGIDMHAAYDLSIPRMPDASETAFKGDMPQMNKFDVKPEVLDLSYRLDSNVLAVCSEGVPMDYPQALDLSMGVQTAATPIANQAGTGRGGAVANMGLNFMHTFDSVEEEMKLLKFLEEQPRKASCNDTPFFLQQKISTPIATYGIIKCINCGCMFDATSFQSHLCGHNVLQQNVVQSDFQPPTVTLPTPCPPGLVKPLPVEAATVSCSSELKSLVKPLPVEDATVPCPSVSSASPLPPETPTTVKSTIIEGPPLLPAEPACIRLLKENQIRIRRFLKDELKYDIYATANTNTSSKNSAISSDSVTNCSSPTDSVSNEILNSSSASTISNVGNQKKPDGPHECTLCERKFVHASGLLRHMEKHAMDLIPSPNSSAAPNNSTLNNSNGLRVVIKCTLCGRIFFEEKAAFNHLCSHFPSSWMDEKEMDNCADIPYESYIDDALNFLKLENRGGSSSLNSDKLTSNYEDQKTQVFLKIVILTSILQCEFCDFVFSDVSYLFVHSACHLPERRFECFSCDIYMKTSKEICTHWQAECVFMRENIKVNQVITQRYFVCNVCENKFQTMDLLHEHRYTSYHFFPRLNKRLGILQLPCEYCELVFENVQDCLSHYEEKHYRKNRKEKEGSTNSSRTRQYLCDICGKSYTQSSHLGQHLRFHQGVKPFACKEPGCTRKFTIRPDLNDHIRKCHTGERPFHCLVCGKRFLTGSVFYQHRLIHRGERRYECEECGKRFYRADALKNHQRIHTGEKPFGCHFCTKNFRQRGDRDKHIRARHSHLDANSRLMMQMQKLQLEAAAAAVVRGGQLTTAQEQPIAMSLTNKMHVPKINLIENITGKTADAGSAAINNTAADDIVMIGNVPFPKSMIESFVLHVDEETVLKGMQQNALQLS